MGSPGASGRGESKGDRVYPTNVESKVLAFYWIGLPAEAETGFILAS